MKFCVLTLISAFLHISHQNPTSQWTLLPHVLVAEVDGSKALLPLMCLQPEALMKRGNESLDIFWKKDGERKEQRGNVYQVRLQESIGGGNYTCHSSDGSLLNHTVVLIQEDETMRRRIIEKTDHEYLKCSALSYSGEISCSWTWHSSRAGTVAFIRAWRTSDDHNTQCSMDTDSQVWSCSSPNSRIRCSLDSSGNSISCVDENHCPYAEETEQIHISVFVKSQFFLVEKYLRHFYLSEIVKPDKVQINKVNASVIQWSYPSSWSSPFSYFPLTFQVSELRRKCQSCEKSCINLKSTKTLTIGSTGTCLFEVKRRSKAVCVRAKDALCDSQWSDWSHLRLKKNKKNNKRA